MSAAEQWIEIKNERGEIIYFNKISGITMQEKPLALRQQEMDSVIRGGQKSYGNGDQSHKTSKDEDLTSLFAQRNLNLPKTMSGSGQSSGQSYNQPNKQQQLTPQQQQQNSYNQINPGAYTQMISGDSSLSLDPAAQYMKKALDTALKGDIVRDIYPTLNYFRTEEKQSDVKRFKNYDNLSKEDAVMVFQEALREAGVTASWKWEDANRVVMHDPRIKAIKTISERKQAFNDFVNEIKTKERNDARTRRQQQKEGFLELLKATKGLQSLSKFYQVAKTMQNDPRFKNIEDKDREEIFQDYLDELMNKEREEKREQTEKTIEKLKEQFAKLNIPVSSKWKEIEQELQEDPVFSKAESLEQISAYEEYIKALERQEFQQKKLEKRRQERKNRENFVKLLEEKLQSRELSHRTKFRQFVKLHKDDPRYFNLVGQPGSNAHELFEDIINEEKDLLKIHKPPFKSLIKSKGIKFPTNVQFDAFDQQLNQYPEYSQLSQKAKVILHEYYLYKVKQKEQEKARKVAKFQKNFEKYLKNIINLNKSSDYSDYRQQIERQSDFDSLNDELKQKSFNEVVSYLKEEQTKKSKKRSRSRGKKSSRDSSVESGEVKTSNTNHSGGNHHKHGKSKSPRSKDRNADKNGHDSDNDRNSRLNKSESKRKLSGGDKDRKHHSPSGSQQRKKKYH